ncbi:hypothetical protein PC119_g6564 [Phytophthora cactorum]|uniref:Uncharacterized protein n=1 Tax=Phytophthora cactorum TaxID=29920 RepID=A0A8T1E5K6_9STRA|nr:hypothetical protein PC117_g6777 [Phytophthora cactorum]KAG3029625.1 hypothetical protein PC119_g6564 [Phytophthora cactorum]
MDRGRLAAPSSNESRPDDHLAQLRGPPPSKPAWFSEERSQIRVNRSHNMGKSIFVGRKTLLHHKSCDGSAVHR